MTLINQDNTVNMQEFRKLADSNTLYYDESTSQQKVAWVTINELIWKLSLGEHIRDYSGIENAVNYIVALKEKADRYDQLTK